MIWILAVITTLGGVTPDVSITKVATFPDQQKCEENRRNMQESAETGLHVHLRQACTEGQVMKRVISD